MSIVNQFGQQIGEKLENWQSAKFPKEQQFKGQYCTLEALSVNKHAKDLFAVLCDEENEPSWTHTPYGAFCTYTEFEAWLVEKVADAATFHYVIMQPGNIAPLGIVAYINILPEHGTIEISMIYAKSLQKTNSTTEAMYLLMKYAFEGLGYRRYVWKCNNLNIASCNAAKRLGFVYEGTFKQHQVIKGYNRDTAWFAITDKAWPKIKKAFELWLDPNNFAENGRQKQRLEQIRATLG